MTLRRPMPYEGMMVESTAYVGGKGDLIDAYLARPLGRGPYPGVIVIPEAFGLVTHIKEVARRIAARGYVALSPELYSRIGPPEDPSDINSIRAKMSMQPDSLMMDDLEGAVTYLNALPYTNKRVGVIGFCSGGRFTLLFACHSKRIHAAVDCWGGRMVQEEPTPSQPVAPIDLVANLSCPLLGLFGEEDQNPTVEHVERLRRELAKHRKVSEIKSYPNAGHAFFADYRPSYRQEAAVDGWMRVFDWFGKHLAA